MLKELQQIRRLLTTPSPGNINAANTELEKLAPCLDEITAQSGCLPDSLLDLRSELCAIAALSQKAAGYYHRLGMMRTSAFGAYERTGTLRTLATVSRMSVKL